MNRAEWRELRKKVLTRDSNTCQRCEKYSKSSKGLSVHHIIPRDEGGADLPNNLITLCHKCHDFVELKEYRNRAEIIGSMELDEPEVPEIQEPESTDWHVWVYGGGRNPNT